MADNRVLRVDDSNGVPEEAALSPQIMLNSGVPQHQNSTARLSPSGKDAYWFAHGGDALIQPTADKTSDSGFSEGKEGSPPLTQKDREERIRHFKDQQEIERQRRAQEIEIASLQAQKNREQLEDERRRKMEELKQKELERRQAVEERKKLIYEAEQERKEAILRRNLEREARIEARRNAQRNSLCFAFGSSTPRTFDLELASLGGSAILLSSSSSRKIEEDLRKQFSFSSPDSRDHSEPFVSPTLCYKSPGMRSDEARACLNFSEGVKSGGSPSTFGQTGFLRGSGALVLGEDLMTQSVTSLSGFSRARRKTDLVPTIPWEGRGLSPRTAAAAGSPGSPSGNVVRAVSMTRLDQLAQPRRRYIEALKTPTQSAATSPSMSKSMVNLPKSVSPSPHRITPLRRKISSSPNTAISSSMLQLNSSVPQKSPVVPFPSSPTINKSKSMMHLAPPSPPRSTRASQLRADLRHDGGEPWNQPRRLSASNKDNLRPPPSRPRSSMSQASEQSVSSSQASTGVRLRPKAPGARLKPRPYSLGACTPPSSQLSPFQRQARSTERKAPPLPMANSHRAKSAGPDASKPKPTPPPKPQSLQKKVKPQNPTPPPPKPVEAASKDASVVEEKVVPSTPSVDIQDPLLGLTPPPSDTETISPPPPSDNPKSNKLFSEEEAKATLAEKRRLAREQAEREAQLERERQEELKRQEEARRLKEEDDQRKFEEEQIRLAEIQRKGEEERLQKAIEEQQAKEAEEKIRREEDAKLKAEREEQERLAKEEAEKQRKELEEKLKREEAERAERKKRVEQIMSRTRGRGNSNAAQTALGVSSGSEENSENNNTLELNNGHNNVNGQHTNGFNNHTQNNTELKEDEESNLDFNGQGDSHNGTSTLNEQFEELIDLGSKNFLNNADQVNSNLDTEHVQPPPFIAFEAKKPDLVDLLS